MKITTSIAYGPTISTTQHTHLTLNHQALKPTKNSVPTQLGTSSTTVNSKINSSNANYVDILYDKFNPLEEVSKIDESGILDKSLVLMTGIPMDQTSAPIIGKDYDLHGNMDIILEDIHSPP